MQVLGQRVADLLLADWLCHTGVAACIETLLNLSSHGMRGQGDDGALPALVAETSRGFAAIEVGHSDVHQDQVVWVAFCLRGGRLLAGLAAVYGEVYVQTSAHQHELHKPPHVGLILGQKHPAREHQIFVRRFVHFLGNLFEGWGFGPDDGLRTPDVKGKSEGTSLAGCAFYADLTAQHLGQPLRDTQPQPGAAESARG